MKKFQKQTWDEEDMQNPFDICINKVVEEVQTGLSRGDIYTMAMVWDH